MFAVGSQWENPGPSSTRSQMLGIMFKNSGGWCSDFFPGPRSSVQVPGHRSKVLFPSCGPGPQVPGSSSQVPCPSSSCQVPTPRSLGCPFHFALHILYHTPNTSLSTSYCTPVLFRSKFHFPDSMIPVLSFESKSYMSTS